MFDRGLVLIQTVVNIRLQFWPDLLVFSFFSIFDLKQIILEYFQ